MGLSQAFGFAKQSGGDITIVSEPGTGTTVTIHLPVAPDHAVASDVDEARHGEADEQLHTRRRPGAGVQAEGACGADARRGCDLLVARWSEYAHFWSRHRWLTLRRF